VKILAGPSACGKTQVLRQLYESARRRGPARLIVPTETLARQLPGATTFATFSAERVPEWRLPSPAVWDREIRDALETIAVPALRSARAFPGFRRRLRAFLDEVASAGVSAAEFERALSRAPYATPVQRAIAKIFSRVELRLAERNLLLSGRLVRLAAAAIRERPIDGACFLDGFYSFSEAELELLNAMADHAPLVLTVPVDWPGAAKTLERFRHRAALETLPDPPHRPQIEKFFATSREHEVSEIARRIAERLDRGQDPSDCGVVVRQESPYAPMLEDIFARYGIPALFHFAAPLGRQSPIRYFTSLIDSLLDGWNLERLHDAIVLPASGIGGTPEGDRLDFQMRDRIPGRGLDGFESLQARFGVLTALSEGQRSPMDWAGELSRLVAFEGALVDPAEFADVWQRRAAAVETWRSLLAETAASLPPKKVPLSLFWDEVKCAIAETAIPIAEPRRESVAVVDAMEARQWRFRAVYLCGMLEGEFPRRVTGDAFFDDAARRELTLLGIPLRSVQEVAAEEQALVSVAATRAEHVTLSWPAFAPNGEDSLPAFALETFPGVPVPAAVSRLEPLQPFRPPARASFIDPAQVLRLQGLHKTWRPTEIDCFLQCPFQYFGRHTLHLQPPPPHPDERFDARAQGTVVHAVLRRLSEDAALRLEDTLDEELRSFARKAHLPSSHLTLWRRTAMLRVLGLFLATPPEREGWLRRYEWPFEFDLVDGIKVKGRIDRFDSRDKDAFAVDYKYSKATRLRKSDATQGGLYLLGLRAAGFSPRGFDFIALREGEIVRWDAAPLMQDSRERALGAISSIGRGEVDARPADETLCRYCDFRSACRIEEQAGVARSAGEAAE
jgi:ATP-dependent helicase/DNAse subunit B